MILYSLEVQKPDTLKTPAEIQHFFPAHSLDFVPRVRRQRKQKRLRLSVFMLWPRSAAFTYKFAILTRVCADVTRADCFKLVSIERVLSLHVYELTQLGICFSTPK